MLVLSFLSAPLRPGEDPRADLGTSEWASETDVLSALDALGHHARLALVCDDLDTTRREIADFDPEVVFNLVDEFRGRSTNDYQIAAWLEALGLPYTGTGPRGLLLAKDKNLAKLALAPEGIRTPESFLCPTGRRPRRPSPLPFPLIVKTLSEEGSVGIANASIVHSDTELADRVAFVHRHFGVPALVERYVEGRELYAAVLGGPRPRVLPLRELAFGTAGGPRIASYRVKWDAEYRRRWKITTGPATELDSGAADAVARLCRRAALSLGIDGYARFDLRLDHEGTPWLLEANPNPFLARGEDFADAAASAGMSFEALVDLLLRHALDRRAARHS